MIAAYVAQALGVALPVFVPDSIGVFTGAILFGATFMGLRLLLFLQLAKMEPGHHGNIIGKLTAVYAIGQILVPAFAGIVATKSGFGIPLITASGVLLAGVGMLIMGSCLARHEAG